MRRSIGGKRSFQVFDGSFCRVDHVIRVDCVKPWLVIHYLGERLLRFAQSSAFLEELSAEMICGCTHARMPSLPDLDFGLKLSEFEQELCHGLNVLRGKGRQEIVLFRIGVKFLFGLDVYDPL